jgi:capsular polysaccharide biosynthesis protein
VSSSRLLWLLIRRGWVVPLAAAVAAAVAVGANQAFPRPYAASSSVVVPSFDPTAPRSATRYADQADKLAVTYAALVPLDPRVRRAVADAAHVDPDEAASRITVSNPPETAVLTLSFEAPHPRDAIAGAAALRRAVLSGDSRAVPKGSLIGLRDVALASHPRRRSTMVAIGIVLGTLLGLVLMLAWDRFDARIDDVETLREIGERPATAFSSITLTSTPILLERWRQLAQQRRPRIALVAVSRTGGWMATQLATQIADVLALPDSQLDAGDGFAVVVERPIVRRRPVAVSPADLFILVVSRGTRAARVRWALNRLAEVGATPDWLLLAPRRWQALPLMTEPPVTRTPARTKSR